MPMHLAIVTPFPPSITGVGQYGYHLSGALARLGAFSKITLLTEKLHPGMQNLAGGFPVDPRITVERIWQPGRADIGLNIQQRLLQLKPDLVWYNLGSSVFGRSPMANLAGLFCPMLSRIAGLPSVVTLHEIAAQTDLHQLDVPGGRLAPLGARLITSTSTRCDVLCVTLRRQANWLRSRYPRLHLIHIPLGGYHPPKLLGRSDGQELLIFATFAPFKGLELLLTAFGRLQKRYPALRLTIAGAEHPRFPGYVEQVRRSYGDQPTVRWMGGIPEAELVDLFGRSSIVVLPYTATTGSSSVLYRAAAWGRPVVSSDLPELRAAASEAGLQVEFFRSGDPDSLAQSLDCLLSNPERGLAQARQNIAAVARTTPDETAHAYLRAFNIALEAHHQGAHIALPVRHSQEVL
ncbi:MAG TPA: glycosyltransferase [Anaerolineales bacterium]